MHAELKKIFSFEELEKRKLIQGEYCFIELEHERDRAIIERIGIECDDIFHPLDVFRREIRNTPHFFPATA